MTRTYTAILTTLLVLLMAGSAMGQPNGNGESYYIDDIDFDGTFTAGDILNITVWVCADGINESDVDFDNVTVTYNASDFGVDEIALELNETDDNCAEYIGDVTITIAQYNCSEVEVLYLGNRSDYCDEICFEIYPADCAYMELENYHYPNEELHTVALAHLWDCNTCPVMWWCNEDQFDIYMLVYSVHLYDEYGNYIGKVSESKCCEEYTATLDSGSSASMKSEWNWWWYGDNKIVIVNEQGAGESTLTVHCVGNCIPDLVQDIEFLQPISSLEVTTNVDVVYESDECSNGENWINISAQILDCYGDPILMSRVDVTLYINMDGYCIEYDTVQTDDDGIALFVDVDVSEYESGDTVTIRAEAECREGSTTVAVVDPVLGSVEIVDPESPMDCGEEQQMEIECFDVNGNPMCCPECCICPPYNIVWTSTDLGEFSEEPGETGLFTALNSGTAVVTVTLNNISDSAEIVINCPQNCTYADGQMCFPDPFVVTSGTVELAGNFTCEEYGCVNDGYACVEAIGDPIGNWTNDTRGAIVDISENDTDNVTLDLDGEGDIWKLNETTGNWSMYDGEIVSGTYALVTEGTSPEPDPGVELGSIEVYAYSPMTLMTTQTPTCTCYDTNGTEMTCPEINWSSSNTYIADFDGDAMVAIHAGMTEITASSGNVTSNAVTVYVDGESTWACGTSIFEMSVDTVTLVVEWPEGGEQCFEVHPVGDPLSYYEDGCSETDLIMIRGAHIDWDTWNDNTYTIFFEYDEDELEALGIEPGTLTILKCDEGGSWVDIGGTDNGIWVETTVTDLCMLALAGEAEPEPDPDPEPESERRRSSGGSGGTYPPEPTPTNATPVATSDDQDKKESGDSDKSEAEPDKNIPYVGDEGEKESIWEVEPLERSPGFAAILAIAGILTVAYLVMKKRD